MKKLGFFLATMLALSVAVPTFGMEVTFHGDMDNRFMIYTDHADLLRAEQQAELDDGTVDESWGELKYRFWTEMGSDDGNIRGVYAVEVGGIHFGKPGSSGKSTGGSYSGDSVNLETRWAYTDFQLPFVDQKARFRIGLMPFRVNKYLWNETATGITFNGAWDMLSYQLAWMRTYEFDLHRDVDDDSEDVDNYLARLNVSPTDKLKAGIFALYQTGDPDAASPDEYGTITPENYLVKKFANGVELDLWNVGIDGSYSLPVGNGKLFFNWDLIYQTGKIKSAKFGDLLGDFDISAYFGHLDAGYDMGRTKLTYTFWYTSGDDDPDDHDFDGFLATDLDITDSIIIFEGSCTSDNVFTERHYLLDKGFIMNRLALDYKISKKMKTGLAALYMMTAEDVDYTDPGGTRHQNNDVGFELDGYITYYLYENLECTLNAGYLFSGDALDYFETDKIKDGSADEDIFLTSARVRYRF